MTSQVDSDVVQSYGIVWCGPLFTKYGAPSPAPTIPLPPLPPLTLKHELVRPRRERKKAHAAKSAQSEISVSGAEGEVPVPKVEVVRAASDPTFEGGDPSCEERSVEGHVGPVAGDSEAGSGNWWDELHRIEKAERAERVRSAKRAQDEITEQLAAIERATAMAEEEVSAALALAKEEDSIATGLEEIPSTKRPTYLLGMAKKPFWIMVVTMTVFLMVMGSVTAALFFGRGGKNGASFPGADGTSNSSYIPGNSTMAGGSVAVSGVNPISTIEIIPVAETKTTSLTTTATHSADKAYDTNRATTFVTVVSLHKATTLHALAMPTPTPYTNTTVSTTGHAPGVYRVRGHRTV